MLGVTPDTTGLLVICSVMGGLLAHVNGHQSDRWRFMGVATAAGQYFAGALIIKGLSSFIPVFGTAVNAGVSLVTVEAIGWAFYLILKDGADPSVLSKSEIEDYLRRGKKLREENSRSGKFAWMDKMSAEDKKRHADLAKELTNADLNPERRKEILRELELLFEAYRPPGDEPQGA
ncbi:hypothetical protein ACHBTE_33915 [Streptomyces sp. M41]|uniref:hypothetical protein n=1 Tax=Streptomyces sp. M41 TaxID=3059412 RepID=UPI00374DBAF8